MMLRVLEVVLPPDLAGDLWEDAGGRTGAVLVGALRMLPWFGLVQLRRAGSWCAAGAGGAAVCLWGLQALWSYVLSSVPLKATAERTWEFWLVEAIAGCAGALLGSAAVRKGGAG